MEKEGYRYIHSNTQRKQEPLPAQLSQIHYRLVEQRILDVGRNTQQHLGHLVIVVTIDGLVIHDLLADYQPQPILVYFGLVLLRQLAPVVLAQRAVEHQTRWKS